jgi:hypothetical protein
MAAYSIILHTGQGSGDVSSTAEVFLTLYGTKASSHEVAVGPGATPRSTADELATEGELVDLGVDLGDITRVRLRHDDPGTGTSCDLDRVVVRAAGTLEEWTFPCRGLLAQQAGGGVTEHTLDAHLP